MPTYTSFWLGIGADPEVYVDGAARFAMAGGDLPMSALRTFTHLRQMSAFLPKADIGANERDVRLVPKADIGAGSIVAGPLALRPEWREACFL